MRTSNQELISITGHTQNHRRGIGMLKALNGPLPGVRFRPAGGIGADNFVDFLTLPNVVYVGGSWVCPANAVLTEDW